MGTQAFLFNLPEPTGKPAPKRKPVSLERNKVDHELAQERYYLHKQLKKYPAINFNGTERWIICPYKNFEAMPIGARYYIKKLMEEYQYNVQYVAPELITMPLKEEKF